MPESPQTHSTSRLEAFSDGVFGVAITLLIVDLHVPRLSELPVSPDVTGKAALLSKLLQLWPNAFAYVMSFAVVLVIWVNHHRIFTLVRRTDQAFLFWNGLMLLFVVLVPFPTALLAEYMLHGDAGQFQIAALVYTGNGVMISMAFRGLWRHAIRGGRLLPADYDRDQIKKVDDEYRWAPAGYVAVFVMAFFFPWVSIGLCFALVVAYSFQGFMSKRPLRRLKGGQDA